MNYLWVYILAGISITTLLIFTVTFSKDNYLNRVLNEKKRKLLINFTLLIVSLASLILIIYLFVILKDQINLLV